MRLIRCDRCGNESERSVFGEVTIQFYEKNKFGTHEQKTLDICEQCKGAFLSWLKSEEGKTP